MACGSLQGSRADWLVEKCTELGACSLRPIITERSPGIGTLLSSPHSVPNWLVRSNIDIYACFVTVYKVESAVSESLQHVHPHHALSCS